MRPLLGLFLIFSVVQSTASPRRGWLRGAGGRGNVQLGGPPSAVSLALSGAAQLASTEQNLFFSSGYFFSHSLMIFTARLSRWLICFSLLIGMLSG